MWHSCHSRVCALCCLHQEKRGRGGGVWTQYTNNHNSVASLSGHLPSMHDSTTAGFTSPIKTRVEAGATVNHIWSRSSRGCHDRSLRALRWWTHVRQRVSVAWHTRIIRCLTSKLLNGFEKAGDLTGRTERKRERLFSHWHHLCFTCQTESGWGSCYGELVKSGYFDTAAEYNASPVLTGLNSVTFAYNLVLTQSDMAFM